MLKELTIFWITAFLIPTQALSRARLLAKWLKCAKKNLCFKRFIFLSLVTLSVTIRSNVYASTNNCGVAGNSAAGAVNSLEYEYKDPLKSFKMLTPADWKIQENFGGFAVMLEPKVRLVPTQENPLVADPNITISVSSNPIPIDDISLTEFENELREKFTQTNGDSDLNIFSKSLMDSLPGGKKGLLYYFSYKKNSIDVVSAMLVMSNKTHRFRVSLTDYKVCFSLNLERYFPIMASLVIEGVPQTRSSAMDYVLPLALVFGLFVGIFTLIRMVQLRRQKMLLDGDLDLSSPKEWDDDVPQFNDSEKEFDDDDEKIDAVTGKAHIKVAKGRQSQFGVEDEYASE